MPTIYSDGDPRACDWLEELVRRGLVSDGVVDRRSITELRSGDLRGFERVHLFAGIGGWDLALRLAGWPDDRPVWTGSCPCQPFSSAGKGKGAADERHLWPEMFRLIRECRPDCIFGEQVASAIGHGWLDGVCANLEAEGYAVGAAVLGAHSVSAPHIRQRLWWCALRLSDAGRGSILDEPFQVAGAPRAIQSEAREQRLRPDTQHSGATGGLSDAMQQRQSGPRRVVRSSDPKAEADREEHRTVDAGRGAWSDFDLIPCADGKTRRIEPGLAPLAHGVPARVVRLRGYGNAIVPQVAAEWIEACMHAIGGAP